MVERDLTGEREDRLPWLETVEPDAPRRTPWARIVGFALVALAAVAALIFGVDRYQRAQAGGNGELIAAQEGDYKVKPDDPGGLKVAGEGDAAIATSAGRGGGGAIDLKAVPETPVAPTRAHVAAPPAPTAAPARNAVAQVPERGGRLVAAAPVSAVPTRAATAGGGGSVVQLGAFPSEAAANQAWGALSKRFNYLAPLGKSVQSVALNGRTLYRLRVNTGGADQAADICGRLKVAGEGCFVAS